MSDLVNFYRDFFGLENAVLSRIEHSEAMVADVYKVDFSSRKPLVLKISSGEHAYHRELHFLDALAGTLPVPKVEKVAEPAASRPGAILMEYLDGALLRECDWTDELAFDVGAKLALLHSKRTKDYGDFTQKKSHNGNAQEYFREKFFEELEECVNHLPEKSIRRCKDYYEAHQYLLDSVDGPCMVHRDFRPGNMIVHNGRLVGIVDWASGRFGFAEQDFCSMEHRKWPRNPANKRALLEGYSSIRQAPNYHVIMPLLRLGRALAVIGFTVTSGTWNGKNREIFQYNREFLENFRY